MGAAAVGVAGAVAGASGAEAVGGGPARGARRGCACWVGCEAGGGAATGWVAGVDGPGCAKPGAAAGPAAGCGAPVLGAEPTPTETPSEGAACGASGDRSGVRAVAGGGDPRGGVATRGGGDAPGAAGATGAGPTVVGDGTAGDGAAASAGPWSRLIRSSTICPSLVERARPSRSRVSPCGTACGAWPEGCDCAKAPPAVPAMAAATSAGSARANVRRIVMGTFTFIQVRHRAENSLSKPMQKAVPAKMIASA